MAIIGIPQTSLFLGVIPALVLLFIIAFIAWLIRDKFAEIIQNFPRLFFNFGG